ncbi:MAG: E3 binding domain-containing protein [Planctomycetales bacterium]
MAVEIKVPHLGDGIESGDVLSILVAAGDSVVMDQGIVELETDKAVAEVPTMQAGQVTAVHVKVGQTVTMGDLLISVEPATTAAAAPPAPPAPPTVPVEPVEPQPASLEDPDPLTREPVAAIPAVSSQPETTPKPLPELANPRLQNGGSIHAVSHDVTQGGSEADAPAGPAVRRYARELGIDLTDVQGTGVEGRITKDDVRRSVRQATRSAVISAVQTTVSKAPEAVVQQPTDSVTPPVEQ